MFTNEDLKQFREIIKEEIALNNTVLSTIFKVELGETNNKIDEARVESKADIKEVNASIQDLERKVINKNKEQDRRIDNLEEHTDTPNPTKN